MDNLSFNCNEFLSCAFAPETEKQHLITLSGEGDWCVIIWQWDQLKILAKVNLNFVNLESELVGNWQLSTKKIGQDIVCVVTGSNCFNYFKIEEMMRSIVPVYNSIADAGGVDGSFSKEFTCHEWSQEPIQLILATAEGEIIVCGMKGEFLLSVPDAPRFLVSEPRNLRIDSCRSYGRGMIFTGEGGMIWPYEATG